jgi:hypothetical protein
VPVTSLRFALDRGERQLWAGAPRRGLVLRASDALLIPFSLMWGGFAVFWEASVLRDGAPIFFALWGVPFVLMGIYITVGRFFVDAARRARTAYAVTNERIVIEVGGVGPFAGSTKSLPLRTLSEVQLRERSDRVGTITFGPQPFRAAAFGGSWPGGHQVPAFDLIPDARRVYDIIREAQRNAASAG